MTQTPREVIEETISQADTLFVAQAAGGNGLVLSPRDLKQILADLKATEAREQRLKEAVETIKELSKWDGISIHLDRCYIEARDVLATLYPDTTAPTQTAGIKVKCIRDNYSGEGKLSFISGKTYEADKTDGDIIVVNEQGSRHIIKTETGLHEFFSTYFEFITPAPKEGDAE